MVQYIHFRILEFPLKKYRCFLGTPCPPPLSEDKCISSLAKKKCQQVLHWIWCLSVYVYVKKKKRMTRSPQFLCQLCFQNMLETHKRCVTFFLLWVAFFVENLFCHRTGSNRLKVFGPKYIMNSDQCWNIWSKQIPATAGYRPALPKMTRSQELQKLLIKETLVV